MNCGFSYDPVQKTYAQSVALLIAFARQTKDFVYHNFESHIGDFKALLKEATTDKYEVMYSNDEGCPHLILGYEEEEEKKMTWRLAILTEPFKTAYSTYNSMPTFMRNLKFSGDTGW